MSSHIVIANRHGAERFRVLVPTTTGPVEVLLLTEEDPAIGRSVACIGGTTETADIDAAYGAFVARPTGVVERLFGHPCYRIDVSGRIDAGSSWQLGVLAAHALYAAGRLAQEREPADAVIWATGAVRAVDLTVGEVNHLREKLAQSLDRLKQEAAAGRRVLVAIPAQNELAPESKADLEAHGIEVLELAAAQSLWDSLALPAIEAGSNAAAAKEMAPRLARWRMWGAIAAIVVCAAAAGLYLLASPDMLLSNAGIKPSAPVAMAPAAHPMGPAFKDCETCPEMVALPAGFFQMGSPPADEGRTDSESPQHVVRFSEPFAIGKFEITVDQFAAFVDATGYQPTNQCNVYAPETDRVVVKPLSFREPPYPTSGLHPASCVSWNDAKAYAAWLSETTGKPYRLPSEAEWEYSARAGTTTPYSFGAVDPKTVCEYAKMADASTHFPWKLETCSSNDGHGAAPVGRHRPNAWGLHDLQGNVWEWVDDCWHSTYFDAPADGSTWIADGDCTRRIIRGGSWRNTLLQIRLARRPWAGTSSAADVRGFRVALTLGR